MYLVITSQREKIEINEVAEILENYCDEVDLQRYDSTPERTEISFIVDINKTNEISIFTSKIKKLNNEVSINLMDYQDLNEV